MLRHLVTVIPSAALIAAAAGAGAAQQPDSPAPGARIRVDRAATDTTLRFGSNGLMRRRVDGRFESFRNDSLLLTVGGDSVATAIPLDAVNHIDVAKGKRHLKGLGLGVLIGAILGAGTGALASNENYGGPAAGAAELGGIGLVLGGIIGAAIGSTHWVEVPLPLRHAARHAEVRVTPLVVPLGHGAVGTGLSLAR